MSIEIIRGYRLCPLCKKPLKEGDYIVEIKPRWWQLLSYTKVVHIRCASGASGQEGSSK